jgi:hypothetical protein
LPARFRSQRKFAPSTPPVALLRALEGEEPTTLIADLDAGATGTMSSALLPDLLLSSRITSPATAARMRVNEKLAGQDGTLRAKKMLNNIPDLLHLAVIIPAV